MSTTNNPIDRFVDALDVYHRGQKTFERVGPYKVRFRIARGRCGLLVVGTAWDPYPAGAGAGSVSMSVDFGRFKAGPIHREWKRLPWYLAADRVGTLPREFREDWGILRDFENA